MDQQTNNSTSSYPPLPRTKVNDENVLASLDLHGMRKPAAIAEVTRFFERISTLYANIPEAWVCIVTGRGSHGSEGPVLRSAVQALLDKRQMQYLLNHRGKGSFVVNAHSGFVLYKEPTATSTKVRVVDVLPSRQPLNRRRAPQFVTTASQQQSSSDPLPREVAANDAELRRAISESQECFQLMRKSQKQEEDALQQALSLSIQDNESEMELQRVLEESKKEQNQIEEEEQLLLQTALEESERNCRQQLLSCGEDMEADIMAAIALSLDEANNCFYDHNEDDQLEQALSISDEEEMIRRALALSSTQDGHGEWGVLSQNKPGYNLEENASSSSSLQDAAQMDDSSGEWAVLSGDAQGGESSEKIAFLEPQDGSGEGDDDGESGESVDHYIGEEGWCAGFFVEEVEL